MPDRGDVPVLGLIVPCFNEEEILPSSAERLRLKLEQLIADGLVAKGSRIYFVDDGSVDGTWGLIQDLVAANDVFAGVKLVNGMQKRPDNVSHIALIIQPTQWKAPGRQFVDHIGDMLELVNLPVAMRFSVPYESSR